MVVLFRNHVFWLCVAVFSVKQKTVVHFLLMISNIMYLTNCTQFSHKLVVKLFLYLEYSYIINYHLFAYVYPTFP
jgi:hypothetical protein